MGHCDFGTELAAVRWRLSDLQRQSAEGSHQVVRLLPEVFEQFQAELEELRIAAEDLCREHEERTADLTAANKRLQEEITERRRAEELARQRQAELAHVSRLSTMGEMASGIAHELNQPLTAIVNYTNGCLRQLRSEAANDDELVSAMERIAGQAERAVEIIRRLGNFVRRREPKRSSVNINDAVQEVLRFVQPDAGQHGITVRINLSEGLTPVPADEIQIQQVILNLFRNGVEAMENGDPQRRVLTVETSAADGNAVKVTIRDTGCGLTDEVLDKLFDPFFTTKPHGMGVGLSISRTIIDAHGGRLWATRNADRGATFTFTLPGANGGDNHAS